MRGFSKVIGRCQSLTKGISRITQDPLLDVVLPAGISQQSKRLSLGFGSPTSFLRCLHLSRPELAQSGVSKNLSLRFQSSGPTRATPTSGTVQGTRRGPAQGARFVSSPKPRGDRSAGNYAILGEHLGPYCQSAYMWTGILASMHPLPPLSTLLWTISGIVHSTPPPRPAQFSHLSHCPAWVAQNGLSDTACPRSTAPGVHLCLASTATI